MSSSAISEETNTDGRPCVRLGRASHIILIEVPKLDTKILAEIACVQSVWVESIDGFTVPSTGQPSPAIPGEGKTIHAGLVRR